MALEINSEIKMKSLSKAMQVLECFSVETPVLGITEIAKSLGISKSNVYNIVSTFLEMGYIEKTDSGKYCLGIKMLEYSFVVNESLGYIRAIYDIINDISQQAQEIVYFGIPHMNKVLYLYAAHPMSRLQFMPYREILGETAPLYCTGIGKAMLSYMPEEEWESRFPKEFKKFTPKTVCSKADLIAELYLYKQKGYALDQEEHELGLSCVGVPVFNSIGKLVGGMSISCSSAFLTEDKLPNYVKLLLEGSYRIRDRLYK